MKLKQLSVAEENLQSLQQDLAEINNYDLSSKNKDSFANLCFVKLSEARDRIMHMVDAVF